MNDCVLKVTCCVCISVDYLHENAFHFLYISFYFVSLFYIINKKNRCCFFLSLFRLHGNAQYFYVWICAKRKTIRCHEYALMLELGNYFKIIWKNLFLLDCLDLAIATIKKMTKYEKWPYRQIITLFRGFRFPFALQPFAF